MVKLGLHNSPQHYLYMGKKSETFPIQSDNVSLACVEMEWVDADIDCQASATVGGD